jgi:hypothetical protein
MALCASGVASPLMVIRPMKKAGTCPALFLLLLSPVSRCFVADADYVNGPVMLRLPIVRSTALKPEARWP